MADPIPTESGRDQYPRVVRRKCQQQKTDEHADHSPHQRIRRGLSIHRVTYERLQK